MNNSNKRTAKKETTGPRGRRNLVGVVILDTLDEFLAHVKRAAGKKQGVVYITAMPEPPLMPALQAGPGAIYKVLTFNAGTPQAPALAYCIQEVPDVTELEYANDFPLKDGRSARQTVEDVIADLVKRVGDEGAAARRGRWELAEIG